MIGAIFPGSDFSLYWLPILLGLIMWWAAFAIILKDTLLGTVMFAVFIASMPSQAEGLFWATNVIAYTIPFFLAAIVLRGPLWVAIPAALLVAGLSEFIGAFMLGLAVFKRDWRLGLASLIGLAANVAAPGNFVRADLVEHGSVFLAAFHTLRNYDSVLSILFDPRMLLFGLFLLTGERRDEPNALVPTVLISLAGVFGLVVLSGGPPPERIFNIICAAIFCAVALLAVGSKWRLDIPRAPFAAVLGLSLLVSPNIGAMIRDLPDAVRGRPAEPLPDAVAGDATNFSRKCHAEWAANRAVRQSAKLRFNIGAARNTDQRIQTPI